MSSGRVDVVVNALILGLTAIAKNPNLGSYKILQTLSRRPFPAAGGSCGAESNSLRDSSVCRVQRCIADARCCQQARQQTIHQEPTSS